MRCACPFLALIALFGGSGATQAAVEASPRPPWRLGVSWETATRRTAPRFSLGAVSLRPATLSFARLRGLPSAESSGAPAPGSLAELGVRVEAFLHGEVDQASERARWIELSEEVRRAPMSQGLYTEPRSRAVAESLSLGQRYEGLSGAAGAAIAAGAAGISYATEHRLRDARACRQFLMTRGAALRAWADANLRVSEEPAPPEVRAEFERRTGEILSSEACRRLRAP
jgi:hypothetical protein